MMISAAARAARRSGARAARPPRSEATSSGSDSELVRIRGLAVGSAERSHTRPRALGEIEHRRDRHRVTVVRLRSVVVVVGGAHVVLDVGGGQAAASAVKGDDLGDRRAERPAPAQQPLGQRTGGARRPAACPRRTPRRMTVTNGWSCRLSPTPGQRVADGPRRPRADRPAAPIPDSWSSCGEPMAPGCQHHLAVGPEQLASRSAAARTRNADRALALELDAQHGRAGAHLEVRTPGDGPQVGVGGS